MKIVEKIKKHGLGESIIIGLKFIKDKCFKIMKFHYLVLNVDEQDLRNKLESFTLVVTELNYKDFLKGDHSVFTEQKLVVIKDKLCNSNYKVYGIIQDDVLLYSSWVSMGNISLPLIKKEYPLLSNEGLLEDAYCNPIARGRGYHSQMNLYRIWQLYKLGKNRVIVIVLDGNVPALKVQYKSGFKDVGIFYCGKILGIQFSTLNKKKYDCR